MREVTQTLVSSTVAAKVVLNQFASYVKLFRALSVALYALQVLSSVAMADSDDLATLCLTIGENERRAHIDSDLTDYSSTCILVGDGALGEYVFLDFSFEVIRTRRCWSVADCPSDRPGSGGSSTDIKESSRKWAETLEEMYLGLSEYCHKHSCTVVRAGEVQPVRPLDRKANYSSCSRVIALVADDEKELEFYLSANMDELNQVQMWTGGNGSLACPRLVRMIVGLGAKALLVAE